MFNGGSGYNGGFGHVFASCGMRVFLLNGVGITVWSFHGVHAVLGSSARCSSSYVCTGSHAQSQRCLPAVRGGFEALDESTVQ
jgi:carbonic anhydrase/acetyltransferase-like protein (isoleucine patch superfamily)